MLHKIIKFALMTVGEAYIDFIKKLKTIYEDREAETISDWIFENLTGMKRWERRASQNKELANSYSELLQRYLVELLQHRPVQYILNEAWFYKMKFFVNEDVLIPRPETEELVEWIVNDFDTETRPGSKTINMIDIGSGSGCISIALKKEFADANIIAIDISESALEVAKKNAKELNASIDFMQIDFLDETRWGSLSRFDLMVSNPPYIPVKEKESLQRNVIDFEPEVALFVEDNDPFIFYKKIARFSKAHLNEGGKIYVEINETKAEDIKEIFEQGGFQVVVKRDIYGKERMVKAIKQTN